MSIMYKVAAVSTVADEVAVTSVAADYSISLSISDSEKSRFETVMQRHLKQVSQLVTVLLHHHSTEAMDEQVFSGFKSVWEQIKVELSKVTTESILAFSVLFLEKCLIEVNEKVLLRDDMQAEAARLRMAQAFVHIVKTLDDVKGESKGVSAELLIPRLSALTGLVLSRADSGTATPSEGAPSTAKTVAKLIEEMQGFLLGSRDEGLLLPKSGVRSDSARLELAQSFVHLVKDLDARRIICDDTPLLMPRLQELATRVLASVESGNHGISIELAAAKQSLQSKNSLRSFCFAMEAVLIIEACQGLSSGLKVETFPLLFSQNSLSLSSVGQGEKVSYELMPFLKQSSSIISDFSLISRLLQQAFSEGVPGVKALSSLFNNIDLANLVSEFGNDITVTAVFMNKLRADARLQTVQADEPLLMLYGEDLLKAMLSLLIATLSKGMARADSASQSKHSSKKPIDDEAWDTATMSMTHMEMRFFVSELARRSYPYLVASGSRSGSGSGPAISSTFVVLEEFRALMGLNGGVSSLKAESLRMKRPSSVSSGLASLKSSVNTSRATSPGPGHSFDLSAFIAKVAERCGKHASVLLSPFLLTLLVEYSKTLGHSSDSRRQGHAQKTVQHLDPSWVTKAVQTLLDHPDFTFPSAMSFRALFSVQQADSKRYSSSLCKEKEMRGLLTAFVDMLSRFSKSRESDLSTLCLSLMLGMKDLDQSDYFAFYDSEILVGFFTGFFQAIKVAQPSAAENSSIANVFSTRFSERVAELGSEARELSIAMMMGLMSKATAGHSSSGVEPKRQASNEETLFQREIGKWYSILFATKKTDASSSGTNASSPRPASVFAEPLKFISLALTDSSCRQRLVELLFTDVGDDTQKTALRQFAEVILLICDTDILSAMPHALTALEALSSDMKRMLPEREGDTDSALAEQTALPDDSYSSRLVLLSRIDAAIELFLVMKETAKAVEGPASSAKTAMGAASGTRDVGGSSALVRPAHAAGGTGSLAIDSRLDVPVRLPEVTVANWAQYLRELDTAEWLSDMHKAEWRSPVLHVSGNLDITTSFFTHVNSFLSGQWNLFQVQYQDIKQVLGKAMGTLDGFERLISEDLTRLSPLLASVTILSRCRKTLEGLLSPMTGHGSTQKVQIFLQEIAELTYIKTVLSEIKKNLDVLEKVATQPVSNENGEDVVLKVDCLIGLDSAIKSTEDTALLYKLRLFLLNSLLQDVHKSKGPFSRDDLEYLFGVDAKQWNVFDSFSLEDQFGFLTRLWANTNTFHVKEVEQVFVLNFIKAMKRLKSERASSERINHVGGALNSQYQSVLIAQSNLLGRINGTAMMEQIFHALLKQS